MTVATDCTTGGYIRLTAEESLKTGLSAPAQRHEIEEYVSRHDLPTLVIYEETRAIGGDVAFDKRPAASRLLADVEAGRVSHVVVRDLDRLTRDVFLWLQLQTTCIERGVTIHTFSGPLSIKSPGDRFATLVRAGAAQLEREQTGDRIRRTKRELARRGRHVGGPAAYGYTSQARRFAELKASGIPEDQARVQAEQELPLRGHLYVDQKEAEVVRLVFDLYGPKNGCRAVTLKLNEMGYRRRSGRLWHPDKVRKIINNPIVAGFVPFDEQYYEAGHGKRTPKAEQVLHVGSHQAIISPETWQRAQSFKQSNRCAHLVDEVCSRPTGQYPLNGLLRCACGALMTGASSRKGGKHAFYRCRRRKAYGPSAEGGCPFPGVRAEVVHAAFWSKLSSLVSSPEMTDRVWDACHRLETERTKRRGKQTIKQRLAKLDADLKLWYRRHDAASADIEREAAWRRIVELTEEFKLAKQEAAGPTPSTVRQISKARVRKWLGNLGQLVGDGNGRLLVQSLVANHGLSLSMSDQRTMKMTLDLAMPGQEGLVVPLSEDVLLPGDRITEWLRQNQGKHVCSCGCGKAIKVIRAHYWKGVPKLHAACRHKAMMTRRGALCRGCLNGDQVARYLGISRTTVARWVKSGKLPKPVKSISGMLLFDKATLPTV